MQKRRLPRLRKLPAIKQRRLDVLLEKNSEGVITPNEKAALERLVTEAEQLMIVNAQRLADFAASQTDDAPHDAVPVTVWVRPDHAKR